MSKFYNTKEVAEILGVSDRSVRRYLNTYFSFENKAFSVSEKMLDVIKSEYIGQGADKVRTAADSYREHNDETEPIGQGADSDRTGADSHEYNDDFDVIEGFTTEEYQEFQKRLIEYPILQKDLEYHRESAKSHQRQMELILRNLEQRNFIEANDKNLNIDK